jgi:hypothetical protein
VLLVTGEPGVGKSALLGVVDACSGWTRRPRGPLGFVARRLQADRVSLLLAGRELGDQLASASWL